MLSFTAIILAECNRGVCADRAARAFRVHPAQSARVVGAVRRRSSAVRAGADLRATAVEGGAGGE